MKRLTNIILQRSAFSTTTIADVTNTRSTKILYKHWDNELVSRDSQFHLENSRFQSLPRLTYFQSLPRLTYKL